jgi:4-amino-4-deoxy-L-arabinose transferase-like glycosyltransferase
MMLNRITLALRNLSERQTLLLLLGLTFVLRLCVVLIARTVANDGAGYGFMARDFMKGEYQKGLSSTLHPFYPFLISLFSPGPAHVELTGRLISLLWGTVTLLPVYSLVKRTVGQKEATFAALFYCLHPHLVSYSGMLLSEATYWGLLTLSVYLFWTGLRKGSLLESMSSSFLLALAYLTRPEAVGYLLVFVVWAAIYGGVAKGWIKKIVLITGIICLFFAGSFPYLLQIRRETGQWLISKKALETQVRYLAADQTKQGIQGPSLEKRAVGRQRSLGWVRRLQETANNIFRYLPFTTYHYLKAYSFTLWIFLFFGLIRKRQEGEDHRYEGFLASMIFLHLFSLATFIPSIYRFSLPLIPISLLWAGAGILPLQRFLKERGVSEPAGWIALFIILMVLIQLPFELRAVRKDREEQRMAGQWLKQNTPPDAVIMSNSPQEAFYAQREFVVLPPALPYSRSGGPSYQEVMSLAGGKGAKYLLVNQDTAGYNRNFFESVPASELRSVYRWDDQKKRFVIIYELTY